MDAHHFIKCMYLQPIHVSQFLWICTVFTRKIKVSVACGKCVEFILVRMDIWFRDKYVSTYRFVQGLFKTIH